MALSVTVVSRTEELWTGKATQVIVPAVSGSMGILPGRQPILAALEKGTVYVDPEGGTRVEIAVDDGFVSVDADNIEVIVEHGTV